MRGIYKIVNKINGKFYLGSSVNFKKRKEKHLRDLKKNTHHSILLQRAYNKYGIENFEFEFIEECENILEREQELLDLIDFSKSYNVSRFSSEGDRICGNPNESIIRAKIKESNKLSRPKKDKVLKGKPDTSGDKNSNWKGGVTFCKCGTRISCYASSCIKCQDKSGEKNPFYNKTHSEETKEKLRKGKLGRYTGNQEKAVIIDDLEYKSLSEASRVFQVTPSTILNRIRNKNYPNYNYK